MPLSSFFFFFFFSVEDYSKRERVDKHFPRLRFFLFFLLVLFHPLAIGVTIKRAIKKHLRNVYTGHIHKCLIESQPLRSRTSDDGELDSSTTTKKFVLQNGMEYNDEKNINSFNVISVPLCARCTGTQPSTLLRRQSSLPGRRKKKKTRENEKFRIFGTVADACVRRRLGKQSEPACLNRLQLSS